MKNQPLKRGDDLGERIRDVVMQLDDSKDTGKLWGNAGGKCGENAVKSHNLRRGQKREKTLDWEPESRVHERVSRINLFNVVRACKFRQM